MRAPGIELPVVATVLTLTLTVALASAQHAYTPADIEAGGRLFQSTCVGCHGPDGDAIAGVRLASGQFRRATSDEELIGIIVGGISGTSMPPSKFSEGEAGTIVAYLRSMATAGSADTTTTGDAGRGRTIVEGKGQCLTCHSVGDRGARIGPDLTAVGGARRRVELEKSILQPDAEIREENRFARAVTREGATVNGRLMNQDTFTLQLLDSKGQLVSLSKSSLRSYELLKTSPMPSYRDKLSMQEVADVVSYLASLKGSR
jgi:putative heme-binding domain-containing protein